MKIFKSAPSVAMVTRALCSPTKEHGIAKGRGTAFIPTAFTGFYTGCLEMTSWRLSYGTLWIDNALLQERADFLN